MKVLCVKKQKNLTENKLYKVIEARPRNRDIHYKVITDDGNTKWFESKVFKYPSLLNEAHR